MPKLIIEFQNKTHEVNLPEGKVTVGRSKKCKLYLPDGNLSREHCAFITVGIVG